MTTVPPEASHWELKTDHDSYGIGEAPEAARIFARLGLLQGQACLTLIDPHANGVILRIEQINIANAQTHRNSLCPVQTLLCARTPSP